MRALNVLLSLVVSVILGLIVLELGFRALGLGPQPTINQFDPVTGWSKTPNAKGERKTRYVTVRGSRRHAQQRLAELLASIGKGDYVEPSAIKVSAYIHDRIAQWHSAGDIGDSLGCLDSGLGFDGVRRCGTCT